MKALIKDGKATMLTLHAWLDAKDAEGNKFQIKADTPTRQLERVVGLVDVQTEIPPPRKRQVRGSKPELKVRGGNEAWLVWPLEDEPK